MTLFYSEGIWGAWYALLWAAIVPFAIMLLWTLLRVSKATSAEESTWLNGAVLGAFFTLIVTSLLSAMLFARSTEHRAWWTYLAWLAVHFVGWTFVGSGVFFASLLALAASPRIAMRRVAAVLAVAGVSLIHFASLYATWRFRIR